MDAEQVLTKLVNDAEKMIRANNLERYAEIIGSQFKRRLKEKFK